MAHHHSFLTRLRRISKAVQAIPPDQQVTLEVRGSYGTYRVVIGPEYARQECYARRCRPHARPIEIFADVDHLFVRGEQVSPTADREVIDHHLQGTVVIHGVAVHIYDAEGSGEAIQLESNPHRGVEIVESINMAGPAGAQSIEALRASGRLTHEAYRIIQRDILKALQSHSSA